MPQSLAQLYVHVIFSTKNREPFLSDLAVREELHRYMGGVQKKLACVPVINGGVEDHAHLLFGLARTLSASDAVKELKRVSSIWLKEKGEAYRSFHWQDGYGVFSVSPSRLDAVAAYIRNQVEHHRAETFQEEYRTFLKKYGIAFDERYLWD
jgi:REP element-mobilizing transposase RayT